MSEDYIHPESGELLATEEEWRAALNDVEDRLAYLYRLRRTLRDGEEGALQVAELPPRIARTPTQEKVARCPRCGGRLISEPPSSRNPLTPSDGEE